MTSDLENTPIPTANAKPLVPWVGGKRRLARHLLPLFPKHKTYVEPFAGAAALYFLKPPSHVEVLNDVNYDLVSLYRVVQRHPDEFLRQFRTSLVSRQMFRWLQDTNPTTLTDIERAARFFYLQKLTFGGKVAGQTFGVAPDRGAGRFNLLRIQEDLSEAHVRLSGAVIECLPWQDCMRRYDTEQTLHFCDPPYWETEGYGVPFPLVEYTRLAETLRGLKGQGILTVNDHPEMRSAFEVAGLYVRTVDHAYSLNRERSKAVRELIVTTFPPVLGP